MLNKKYTKKSHIIPRKKDTNPNKTKKHPKIPIKPNRGP